MADTGEKDNVRQVAAILETAFKAFTEQSKRKLEKRIAENPKDADAIKAEFNIEQQFLKELQSSASALAKGNERAIVAYKDTVKAVDALKIEYFDDKPSQRFIDPAKWHSISYSELGEDKRKIFDAATTKEQEALDRLTKALDDEKNGGRATIINATTYTAGIDAEKEFSEKEKTMTKLLESMKDVLEPDAKIVREQQREIKKQGGLFTVYKEAGEDGNAAQALKAAQAAKDALEKAQAAIKAKVFEHAGKEMSDQEKTALYEHVLKSLTSPADPEKENKQPSKQNGMIPQEVKAGLAQVTAAELPSEAAEGPATLSFPQPAARRTAVRTPAA